MEEQYRQVSNSARWTAADSAGCSYSVALAAELYWCSSATACLGDYLAKCAVLWLCHDQVTCGIRYVGASVLWYAVCVVLQALEVCAEKKKRILLIQQEIKANPVSHKRTGALAKA